MTNSDTKQLIDLVVEYGYRLNKQQGDVIKAVVNGDNVDFCDIIETSGLLTCSAVILEKGLYLTWNIGFPEQFVVCGSEPNQYCHKFTLTEWLLNDLQSALEALTKEND